MHGSLNVKDVRTQIVALRNFAKGVILSARACSVTASVV